MRPIAALLLASFGTLTAQDDVKVRVVVEDVAPHLASLKLPGLKGKAILDCTPKGDRIEGRRAMSFNGFDLELRLWAKIKPEMVGKEVSAAELQELRMEFKDDELETKDVTEKDIPRLIEELKKEENKVELHGGVIPGGEILGFSLPMKKLMKLGSKARGPLQEKIKDESIGNEVALILGAIGDETTVPLLIDAYPETIVKEEDGLRAKEPFRHVCMTFALTYLTGEPIGRSREGADLHPGNKARWKAWWDKNGKTFRVPMVKPRATWVPSYPTLEWAKECREQFMKNLEEKR
jgi:hypothetical protein